ncbi:MAG: AAA family ATPase [Dehalococcoidia bacterium]|nr:AAA family ATPase [Dehalococcoidia bacterium]
MNNPKVVRLRSGHDIIWDDVGVIVQVRRIDDDRHDIKAELTILYSSTPKDSKPVPIKQWQFNLLAAEKRASVVKDLEARYNANASVNWYLVMEITCSLSLEIYRQGEEVIELDPFALDVKEPEYMLFPLVVKGQTNIIYAKPNSGKSIVGLGICATCMLPWVNNSMGWDVRGSESRPVLYLDWESDKDDMAWNLKRLINGGVPPVAPLYRRCSATLPKSIESVLKLVDEKKPSLVVIDSLGMAAGGDLNATEPAFRFLHSVRKLETTVLLIAHPAKNDDGKTSVFGSQFYTAEARNIWEIVKTQDVGDESIELGFYHKKAPTFSKIQEPIGLRITFDKLPIPKIMFHRCNPIDNPELLKKAGTQTRILEYLKDNGKTGTDIISQELDIPRDNVRVELNRMKSKNLVYKFENNTWGVAAYE